VGYSGAQEKQVSIIGHVPVFFAKNDAIISGNFLSRNAPKLTYSAIKDF